MVLRADRACCGGYTASASRFGGAALLAGLSTCMMGRGRRGGAGPGPWLVVLACASLSRRVLLFEWLLGLGSLQMRYDVGGAYEEPVCRGAGRSRRRARGDDGVLVWSGVALPCLCGGSRRRVSSFEGERATASFSSVGRSLHRLCVRNVVFVYVHRHGGYDYVIAPRSGRGPGGHSSPLQVVNVKAALFRRVLGHIALARAAREPYLA